MALVKCWHCGTNHFMGKGERGECMVCHHHVPSTQETCRCQQCQHTLQAAITQCMQRLHAGVRVVGRGFAHPVVTCQVDTSSVVIRVDDKANPESWLELSLTREACEQLIHAMGLDAAARHVMLPDYEVTIPDQK